MRTLSKKTIIKAFKQIGFTEWNEQGDISFFGNTASGHISVSFPPDDGFGNIVLSDCRWTKRGNVHIVSYWYWPRNMKALNQAISDIKDTYITLCAVTFKDS